VKDLCYLSRSLLSSIARHLIRITLSRGPTAGSQGVPGHGRNSTERPPRPGLERPVVHT